MVPTTRHDGTIVPRSDGDPLREFDRIAHDLSTWVNTWHWPPFEDAVTALGDLEELDGAFVLEVDLPGIRKGDVDVQLEGRRLTITANRRDRRRGGLLRRRTRHVGTYRHEVLLPADVDPDAVDAQLEDGVLTVRLGKTDSTSHRIRVR